MTLMQYLWMKQMFDCSNIFNPDDKLVIAFNVQCLKRFKFLSFILSKYILGSLRNKNFNYLLKIFFIPFHSPFDRIINNQHECLSKQKENIKLYPKKTFSSLSSHQMMCPLIDNSGVGLKCLQLCRSVGLEVVQSV